MAEGKENVCKDEVGQVKLPFNPRRNESRFEYLEGGKNTRIQMIRMRGGGKASRFRFNYKNYSDE